MGLADLIDRDRLLKYIDGMSIEDTSNNLVFKTANTVLLMFKQVIEAIPKADTERHAHWGIWDEDTNTYECSNCKNPFTLLEGTPEQNTYFYCPYCGCKMDEEQE